MDGGASGSAVDEGSPQEVDTNTSRSNTNSSTSSETSDSTQNETPNSGWIHKTKTGQIVDLGMLAENFSDPFNGIRLFQTYFDIFTGRTICKFSIRFAQSIISDNIQGAEVADFIIANCQCTRNDAPPIGQGNPYFDKTLSITQITNFLRSIQNCWTKATSLNM